MLLSDGISRSKPTGKATPIFEQYHTKLLAIPTHFSLLQYRPPVTNPHSSTISLSVTLLGSTIRVITVFYLQVAWDRE